MKVYNLSICFRTKNQEGKVEDQFQDVFCFADKERAVKAMKNLKAQLPLNVEEDDATLEVYDAYVSETKFINDNEPCYLFAKSEEDLTGSIKI